MLVLLLVVVVVGGGGCCLPNCIGDSSSSSVFSLQVPEPHTDGGHNSLTCSMLILPSSPPPPTTLRSSLRALEYTVIAMNSRPGRAFLALDSCRGKIEQTSGVHQREAYKPSPSYRLAYRFCHLASETRKRGGPGQSTGRRRRRIPWDRDKFHRRSRKRFPH